MRATIQVSDPWEFPDDSPLDGVVVELHPDSAVVLLDQPIQYEGRSFREAALAPRHSGHPFKQDGTRISAHIALLAEDADRPTPSRSDWVSLIGTALFNPDQGIPVVART
jgi:hypothetical protein